MVEKRGPGERSTGVPAEELFHLLPKCNLLTPSPLLSSLSKAPSRPMMNRVLLLSVVLGSVILCASMATFDVVVSGNDSPYTIINGVLVDNQWLAAAGTASATDRLYAVIGYDHPPTATDVSALSALGLTAIPYAHLPYAAVGGTRDQISASLSLVGVRSIHANRIFRALSHGSNPDP